MVRISCTSCRKFYSSSRNSTSDVRGRVENQVDKLVKGTLVVKKSNFSDHVSKSRSHQTAVIRLNEKRRLADTESLSSSTGVAETVRKPVGKQQSSRIYVSLRNNNMKILLRSSKLLALRLRRKNHLHFMMIFVNLREMSTKSTSK